MTKIGLAAALFICGTAFGGKYNLKLDIGDPAPLWKNLPGVDGKRHSAADLKDKQIIVAVFTCNSCPYAVDCEDRLIGFVNKYRDKSVALVAINVNKAEDDNFDAMKKRAREKKFNFPYLFDETQQIAKDFGAGYTPEFFVLDKNRKIAYMGSMDNSPNGKKITEAYLDDAVTALLGGKTPAVAETVPIGCRVRYERARRKRD